MSQPIDVIARMRSVSVHSISRMAALALSATYLNHIGIDIKLETVNRLWMAEAIIRDGETFKSGEQKYFEMDGNTWSIEFIDNSSKMVTCGSISY